jgi:hypothetical protein
VVNTPSSCGVLPATYTVTIHRTSTWTQQRSKLGPWLAQRHLRKGADRTTPTTISSPLPTVSTSRVVVVSRRWDCIPWRTRIPTTTVARWRGEIGQQRCLSEDAHFCQASPDMRKRARRAEYMLSLPGSHLHATWTNLHATAKSCVLSVTKPPQTPRAHDTFGSVSNYVPETARTGWPVEV